jgi:hypothetical protein
LRPLHAVGPLTVLDPRRKEIWLAGQGKFAEADGFMTEILDAQRRYGAPENVRVSSIRVAGWVRLHSGRPAEAEALFREALAILDKTSPDSWARFATQSVLGASLSAQHKNVEAETLLLSGYEGLKKSQRTTGFNSEFTLQQASEAIAKFYRDSGQPEKALAWRNLK